jgi:hypothetical protein
MLIKSSHSYDLSAHIELPFLQYMYSIYSERYLLYTQAVGMLAVGLVSLLGIGSSLCELPPTPRDTPISLKLVFK